ncbi:MAG: DUF58 domain-containing protein [Dehalococcoidia bacterium]
MDTSELKNPGREEKSFSLQPPGYLLSKLGLLILAGALIVAAWFGHVVIVIVLGLCLSAAVLSRLWSRWSLARVECQRTVSEHRLFPGEQIELKLRLTNRKLLPLPWVQVDDEVPIALTSNTDLRASEKLGYALMSKATALLWYTAATWKLPLHCNRRGYYQLGPMTVTSGDIFGFYPRSRTGFLIEQVIVYPRIYPITYVGLPSLYPVGDITTDQRIFEDPTRIAGVRDYSPRDGWRRIHWKASARRQCLQVKVFEPTMTLKVALFLVVDSFQREQSQEDEEFELGISVAASLANHLIEKGSAVGLFVNSRLADSGQPGVLLPGSSISQMTEMLETLAKVTSAPSVDFEQFFQAERSAIPWGTTLAFIGFNPSPTLKQLIADLRQGGHRVSVFSIGDAGGNDIEPGIPWYNVRTPEDLERLEMNG